MPELDGYQFMQQIRALPQGQSIPALALTAFVDQEDQAKAIQAEFQGSLKDITIPALERAFGGTERR